MDLNIKSSKHISEWLDNTAEKAILFDQLVGSLNQRLHDLHPGEEGMWIIVYEDGWWQGNTPQGRFTTDSLSEALALVFPE